MKLILGKPPRGYFEMSLKYLIEYAGGKKEILKQEDPYHYLTSCQEKAINELLYRYKEVGELFPQEIGDYVDNLKN